MADDTPGRVAATLSGIRERSAERAKIAPGLGADPADFPRLLAAVDAALKRHVEAVIEDMPNPFRYCKTCSGHPAWPCPEVAAITAALTGTQPSEDGP